ncbi:amidohydrolase [Flavobacterium selenitireducens]|uniref:amidohydrolase n=1 Tax=Flavobacterium selenitireducens TaxID=2722704 RepID=UPI00168B7F2A|nr:amidohydrolase [Flavobacterium selenitireducens]MBD3582131.1 amidohydrolase [Flavobacterium selenitireducens]
MQNTLKIALVQTEIVWQDPDSNRALLYDKIDPIADDLDIIVLPEMFATGFTMSPSECAETMNGPTITWMKDLAAKKNSAVVGSLAIEDEGLYFNRLLFVQPDGEISIYDKRHLFSLAGEDEIYTAGNAKLILTFRGFRICPLICYDLRFPAFSRNNEDFDLMIYVANWPKTRIVAWDALLKARAIENMCYVAAVNRIGEDQNGHFYPGHSQGLDFLGEMLVSSWENEGIFVLTIDKESLTETRDKLGFLRDRDVVTVS